MTREEIMRMAREAGFSGADLERFAGLVAITEMLQEALSQPEPVIDKSAAIRIATAIGWEPKRKPLTDEELYKVFPAIATYTEANKTLYRSIARAIEAAHGIKENNT